jgi:hypothetical protein
MTRLTSTGTAGAAACPVTRSTTVSAMICARLRGSPAARMVSACRLNATRIATCAAALLSTLMRPITSGAGRNDTARSAAAAPRRATNPSRSA